MGPRSLRTRAAGSDPKVDAYIERAPTSVRRQLTKVRAAIRGAAPGATEQISYRMPGYSFPGYPLHGMFAWFGLQTGHIGLYLRPPTIRDHRRELAEYRTTKSAVHLPLQGELPDRLIRNLVRTSIRIMKSANRRRGGRETGRSRTRRAAGRVRGPERRTGPGRP